MLMAFFSVLLRKRTKIQVVGQDSFHAIEDDNIMMAIGDTKGAFPAEG